MNREDFESLARLFEVCRNGNYPQIIWTIKSIAEFLALYSPKSEARWISVPLEGGGAALGFAVVWLPEPKFRFCFLPTSWLKLKSFACAELIRRGHIAQFEVYFRFLHWLLACLSILQKEGDYVGFELFADAFKQHLENFRAGVHPAPETVKAILEFAEQRRAILPLPEDLAAQEHVLLPQSVPGISELFMASEGAEVPVIFFSQKTRAWEILCLVATHLVRQNSPYQSVAYQVLRENIELGLREITGSTRDTDDIVGTLAADVVLRFHQSKSAHSLRAYLKKRLKSLFASSQRGKTFSREIPPNATFFTVTQAVGFLLQSHPHKSEQGLQRWLYRKLHSGEIPNRGGDGVLVGEDGYVQRKSIYLIDREGVERARTILESAEMQRRERALQAEMRRRKREQVRELAELYRKLMKVTPGTAYRWVWKHLRQGKTADELQMKAKERVLRSFIIRKRMAIRKSGRRAAEIWLKNSLAQGETLEALAQKMLESVVGEAKK